MADISTGSETDQFAQSLGFVKSEIEHALDQAAAQLDAYSEQGNADNLRAFLEEIQQVRGIFKMLDFRAGERLCEELAETGRVVRSQEVHESTLNAFTQALVFIKRYLEFVVSGDPVVPGLLVPTINLIRGERREKALPEAYFFMVNLRPQINTPPAQANAQDFPYRRARQMYQLGLIGLIRGQGRKGPVNVMLRSVRRFEAASRGTVAWLFWNVVTGALEAMAQDDFEMTPQRLALLGVLDRQVRRIQDSEGKALAEKLPDWLLKEFLYLVALAEPETSLIQTLQQTFHVTRFVREKDLLKTRAKLRGPDQSAMNSLAEALQDEIQAIKDFIDLFERIGVDEANFSELLTSLSRVADTLSIANLAQAHEHAVTLLDLLKRLGVEGVPNELISIADAVMRIEQDVRALTQRGLDQTSLVDPVSLNEARIALQSESMGALSMVKRAIAAYLDSNNDKLHVRNIGKSLIDVAGAMVFFEKPNVSLIVLELERFVRKQVLEAQTPPSAARMEAFADAVSAVEYYLDSINGQTAGAEEALRLATESVRNLQG